MIRTLTPLVVAAAVCASATAQHAIIRHGRPAQPAGVIAAPSLPIAGGVVGGVPGVATPAPLPRPFLRPFFGNALWGSFGYDPGYYWQWPGVYDMDTAFPAMARAAQFNPTPVYVPSYVTAAAPSPPQEQTASLTLNVPLRSQVWLNGKEVDANVRPLVLQSPPLQEDQSYTFDVKVTWSDNGKTEERTRTVTVGAGDQTSLTYRK